MASVAWQLKMEKFYDDLAMTFKEKKWWVWSESRGAEKIRHAHLLLFGELLIDDAYWYERPTNHWFLEKDSRTTTIYDSTGGSDFIELLTFMGKRGYEIVMNFYAEDVVLGNVAVKIDNKWFAFGQCKNSSQYGRYISEIWPLRYMIPRMDEMETKLAYAIPVPDPDVAEQLSE